MSGIKVNRSLVIEKTMEMDRQLKSAEGAAARTFLAVEGVEKHAGELRGKAWDSVRSYVKEVQEPLNKLYRNWVEAQQEGNRKYREEAGYLPVNDMDEDAFRDKIGEYRRKIQRERRRLHPNGSLIRFYERKIRMYEGFLNRLYTFVRRTENAYGRAESLLRLLERGDSSLAEVNYDAEAGILRFGSVDRKWLNEVKERNAREEDLKRGSIGETPGQESGGMSREEMLRYIDAYWERTDGYFGGNWWQDEGKLAEAAYMFREELKLRGSINMVELGIRYEKKGTRNNRMLTVQALAFAGKTGEYDDATVAQLENNLSVKGIGYGDSKHCINAEMVEALSERYEEYPEYAKRLTFLLENGIQWERGDTQASKRNLTEKQKEAAGRYDAYWERQDGYFSGKWWQDEKKVAEAARVLEEEMKVRGGISLIELTKEYEAKGARNVRMEMVQVLANAEKSGSYDNTTLTMLENNLVASGVYYSDREKRIDAEIVGTLIERYKSYPETGKKFTYFLENGGDRIFAGAELLAAAAIQAGGKKLQERRYRETEMERVQPEFESTGNMEETAIENSSESITSQSELMSPEEAERYIKYSESGSAESLTRAELEGISSEGEQLALKKVNGEALPEIRNCGNVIESGSKADVLAQNRANGRAFEQQEFAKFSSQNNNAVEQITVKTSSGVKTRVDAIGLDANGNVVINEYKSSLTAPLTSNQKIAFPGIFESGATVVGKGKGIFSGGYQIPPGTKVTIIRPE